MIIAKFYPNGEFTQGIYTSRQRKPASTLVSPPPPPPSKLVQHTYLQCQQENADIASNLCVGGNRFTNGFGVYTYLHHDTQGYHYAYEEDTYVLEDVVFLYPPGYMIGLGLWQFEDSSPTLVYQTVESSPSNSEPPKSRKKLKNITKNMARNVRNGAFILEQEKQTCNLSFLTLTIPELLPENHLVVLQNWGKLTDSILKWLRKQLAKKGIIFRYVYCTEIQIKRYDSTGRIAPHLHIAFNGRTNRRCNWAITPQDVRKSWAEILDNVLPTKEEFQTSALENLQRVKGSVTRYLGKYMSKGLPATADFGEDSGMQALHTQWGGMDRVTSRTIKRHIVRLSSSGNLREVVISFTNSLEQLLEVGLLKYFRRGIIDLGIDSATGMERTLRISSGCLSTATLLGGLVEVIRYLEQI